MADVVTIMKDGDIATVLLNRPEAFNAFDMETAESFAAHLIALAADREIERGHPWVTCVWYWRLRLEFLSC
jgi:enoyl-CoA hydratase/carnithine racemase